MPRFRHVLLDADGVVQTGTGDIPGVLAEHLGDGGFAFLAATFPDDSPVLRGEAEVVPLLREALRAAGKPDVDVQRLYDEAWLAIEVHRPTLDLVATLRARGYGVHLVTNQDPGRARHMQRTLGYQDVFDSCWYSCDVGAAKPDAAFFAAVLEGVGARPDEVLYVDDSPRYVAGGRAAGITAEEWSTTEGDERLHALLEQHGIALGPARSSS
ncbi:HAD-IA family hydrolase [Nocardioides sp. TF02-7]|nr:HAD-IA family hydrolase [Nocardioides sp. TF02-7]UMG94827.1 HAD-IA family hydrolase [Nocardioides sp. TF02-7]